MKITVDTHLVTVVKDGTARIYLADANGNVKQMAQVTVPLDISPERASVLTLSIANVMDDARLDMRVEKAPRPAALPPLPALPKATTYKGKRRGRIPGAGNVAVKKERLLEVLKAHPGLNNAQLAELADCHEAYVAGSLSPYIAKGIVKVANPNGGRRVFTWVGDEGAADAAAQSMADVMEIAQYEQKPETEVIDAPGIGTPELFAVERPRPSDESNATVRAAMQMLNYLGAANTTDIANELGLSPSYVRRTLRASPWFEGHSNPDNPTAPVIWGLKQPEAMNGQR